MAGHGRDPTPDLGELRDGGLHPGLDLCGVLLRNRQLLRGRCMVMQTLERSLLRFSHAWRHAVASVTAMKHSNATMKLPGSLGAVAYHLRGTSGQARASPHLAAALDGEAPRLLMVRHSAARRGQLRLQARQRRRRGLGLLLAGPQRRRAVLQLSREARHLLMQC